MNKGYKGIELQISKDHLFITHDEDSTSEQSAVLVFKEDLEDLINLLDNAYCLMGEMSDS